LKHQLPAKKHCVCKSNMLMGTAQLAGAQPRRKRLDMVIFTPQQVQDRTELISTASTRAECLLCFGFTNFVRRCVPAQDSHWLPLKSNWQSPRKKIIRHSRRSYMLSGDQYAIAKNNTSYMTRIFHMFACDQPRILKITKSHVHCQVHVQRSFLRIGLPY
jgi:hypothetical protein